VIEGLLRKDPKQRLDVAAARRMLQSVLDAPEATAAPTIASRPPGAARTTPPGAAAAFGAGAGPAAAAAPPRRQPAPPEPTMASPTPAGRPVRAAAVPPGAGATLPPTRSGSVRRRVGKPLLALLVVLLVVAAGVFAAVAAHHGKHNTAHPGSGDRATTHPTAPGSAPPSASAGSSPAASAPASAPAATGFHRVQGPGGASLEIPTGWVLMKQSGSSWTYKGLAGTLQIDATSTPGSSAVGAWQSEESAISRSFTNYQRVRLETVTYRGGWDAADWEWTYSRGGTTLHALNRGFVTDARHGYAIYWTAADSTWSGARNQELLHRFFSSFQPAG
jgi:hypothetical protein